MTTDETTCERVDVLVIGAGPGGYHAAIRASQLGKSVLCVDGEQIGGVCVNKGCIPTKALLHVAETLEHTRRAARIGVQTREVVVDVDGVRRFASDVVRANVSGLEALFKSNGVAFARARARFVGPDQLVLEGSAERRLVRAQNVVIATGAQPGRVPIFPCDGRLIVTSDDAVRLPDVPARLLIVGGGVVGLEFATVYQRLGSSVTIVEHHEQLLPGTDPDIASLSQRTLLEQGIDIQLGTRAESPRFQRDSITVALARGAREFDRVLVAVGRSPVVRGLDLWRAGLEVDAAGFIPVDLRRQTRVPGIWAVGDVVGGPMVAHKAMREGVVVAEAIAGDPGAAYDPVAVPSCVYTDPQVATVGLSEPQAVAAGYEVKVGKFPLGASGRARTMGESRGLTKVVADARTGRVLGVHLLGPHAESLIGEAVIALETASTLEDLALSIHPHPTLTETLHDAAEAALGKAIHVVNRGAVRSPRA